MRILKCVLRQHYLALLFIHLTPPALFLTAAASLTDRSLLRACLWVLWFFVKRSILQFCLAGHVVK